MSQTQPFSQTMLDWFEEGDTLETRPDQAGYQPFTVVSWRAASATAASVAAVFVSLLWLVL